MAHSVYDKVTRTKDVKCWKNIYFEKFGKICLRGSKVNSELIEKINEKLTKGNGEKVRVRATKLPPTSRDIISIYYKGHELYPII